MKSTVRCRNRAQAACLTGLLAMAMAAGAAPVVATVGQHDGFGSGVAGQSGDSFVSFFVADGGPTGSETDRVYSSEVTLGFDYDIQGAVVQAATLRLFTGGWGVYGRAQVSVNGRSVGQLTDGDDPLAQDPESAWLDVFDLSPLLSLLQLDGSDAVTISIIQADASDPAPVFDFGAIDFGILELTVASDSGGTIPEPASLALTVLGFAVAGVARRCTANR
jgi:hypothetical protein